MGEDMIVGIVLLAVLVAAVVGLVIYQIVWFKKIHKKYFYHWQAHEIVFEIASRSVRLYVDGNVEDELGAQNIRICTLRTFVEGTEVKARMAIKGMRVQLEVTAGNTPLPLIGMGK